MKNILLAFFLHFASCVQAQIITTVAGNGLSGHTGDSGLATLAKLSYPSFVIADQNGDIYFTERTTHSIRKVSSGIITTVAGTGVAGYFGDSGQLQLLS